MEFSAGERRALTFAELNARVNQWVRGLRQGDRAAFADDRLHPVVGAVTADLGELVRALETRGRFIKPFDEASLRSHKLH